MLAAVPQKAAAVSPYPTLSEKAYRFFEHKEWASASAMFTLMLDERPEVPDTYGRAIVVEAIRGNTAQEMDLMQKALDNHIPFDSVFSRVRQWSFHLGQTNLYEEFLKETRATHPWMRRSIDSQLLKYYTFRRNGAEMIDYSRLMLAGAPDNIDFLTTLAEGYMLIGDSASAMEVYRTILTHDPRNYNALLSLGNWYLLQPDTPSRSLAKQYLTRAYAERPTPYVATQLASLKPSKKK